jgi:pSer/pThr/pTyr-binding forkhead associated (FHA) protein
MPPANPYGATAGGATIVGALGQFSVRQGSELRVGRDPAQCPVFLQEPRVSGVHATLKFEGGQLWVRDESSNNGTFVDGTRIAAGVWTPVNTAGQLRFGPIDFGVRLDA